MLFFLKRCDKLITMSRIPLLFLSFISFTLFSQTSDLKLSEIMKGYDYIGHSPEFESWSPDGNLIYFTWQKDTTSIVKRYQYNIQTQEIVPFSEQYKNAPFFGFVTDKETGLHYYQIGSSIYHFNDKTKQRRIILKDYAPIQLENIHNGAILFKRQEDRVWNYMLFDQENNSLTYLTQIKNGISPDTTQSDATFLQEQSNLFMVTKEKRAKTAAQKDYNQAFEPSSPPEIYTDGKTISESNITDNHAFLGYVLTEYPKNKSTAFMSYVNEEGHSKKKDARPKVTDYKNPIHNLYLFDLNQGKSHLIDLSDLEGIHERPDYLKEYNHDQEKAYTKDLFIHLHGFNDTGAKLLVELKSHDNKDRWIGTISTKTKRFHLHNHQHDEAWIGGPGITGWNMVAGNMGWINSHEFYYQSEATGYSHLYSFDLNTKESKALTKGEFEIHDAKLSQDKSCFYLTTNQTHPGNRDFYHLDIQSKKLVPILTKDGFHEVHLSPDEKWLLVAYDYKNQPTELYLCKNTPNAAMKRLTFSQQPAFTEYPWRAPEVITFKASDQVEVPARIYQPDKGTKNGAAILFVHGAGYLQNAHNGWSGYYREYMFHNLLCDLGYTVLDIDYRASKGYGRDFRTAIYRHMGGRDLADYRDARRYLVDNHDIDSNRVGIYGGSYGGFITLMALLTAPDEFACGAAIRSVTDWAHYNYPYTSNILNTPELDPKAYEKSSPIYFAEGLKSPLLMLHGMIDDNVQYQDVVRLSQRFIELGKKDWDLVGYPIEPHGFKEASSWTDEYGRILELFNEHLLR